MKDVLECDDDMSDAGHGICGLSVDGKVLVLPEDIGFIWLRSCGIEKWGIYLGVECGVDDAAERTS